MFCTKCGANNADTATFCTGCGAPLKAAQTPVQPQPQQYQAQPQQYQAQPQQYQAQPQQQFQAQNLFQVNTQGPAGNKPMFGLAFLGNESADPQKALMQKIAKLCIAIGMLLCFISVFMPFYKVSFWGMSETVNLFGMEGFYTFVGVLVILASLAGIALAILLKGAYQKFATCCGAINFLFIIIAGIKANSDAMGIGHLSVAFWFILIGSIACIAGGVLTFIKQLDQ